MKTQVLVLIPYSVAPEEFAEHLRKLLEPHRLDQERPERKWRFDYLVGALEQSLHDSEAEGRLPPAVRRAYAGNICDRTNLPAELVPGALVTPDGVWHDLSDHGWRMTNEPSAKNSAAMKAWESRYRELLAEFPHGWVLEIWAHS